MDLGSVRVHDLDLDDVMRLDRVVAVAGHLERQHLPEKRRKRGRLFVMNSSVTYIEKARTDFLSSRSEQVNVYIYDTTLIFERDVLFL